MTKRCDYLPECEYKIWQDGEQFSYTTDSVLLGNFPHIVSHARVLDLGCGTGAIGMLCAWRGAEHVTAVDLNPDALTLLEQSIQDNGLAARFTIQAGDIRHYKEFLSNESFDLVVANPPYRTAGARRVVGRTACHEETVTLEDFFRAAAFAVKYRGRFALVQLPERFVEAVSLAQKYGLQPKRLQWIHGGPDKPAWIFLMEMQKGGSYGLKVLPPFVRQ